MRSGAIQIAVGALSFAAAVTGARSASAQPTPTPPTEPAPASGAIAPDGEARGYEQAPVHPEPVGAVVVGGIGTGLGYAVRGLFLPFRGAIYADQRWQVRHRLDQLFWNDDHTLGLVPTGSYSLDSGPTYGVQGIYRDFLGNGETLSASADTGGVVVQAYQLSLDLPRIAGGPLYLQGRIRYEDNEGSRFAGIGNGPTMSDDGTGGLDAAAAAVDTRFAQQRFLSTLRAGVALRGGTVRLGASGIFNDRSFRAAPDGATPSIGDVYDTSTIAGYDEGFQTLELGVDIAVDTRDTPGATGAGGVARAFAGVAPFYDDQRYAHYGGELAYHITPFLPGRVLGARIALEGTEALDGEIPFTELPRLGGSTMLRGYSSGQFRDRLATVGTLEYRYPIHANVSGELFVEAGKVAHTYDELAGSGLGDDWHVGYGGGLLVHTTSSLKLRADVAYGDGLHLFLGTDVLDAFRDREKEL
jgi:outer membrane protein assembly factor BamA